MRLFLDANVLFTAAHHPHGKAALVMAIARTGIWQSATSAYALEEARRNIIRKFPSCLDQLETDAGHLRIMPDVPAIVCPRGLVEKDRPIFRAARGCRADVLLTGDIRDFGFLMNAPDRAGGLLIQTVGEFLAAIESGTR